VKNRHYETIFGPIPSRRFGVSLGIDLSPGKKQCNFDCLYCELSPSTPVAAIENPPPVEQIVSELKEALEEHPDTEVITLTANGEPTLYPDLELLIDRIGELKGTRRTLILSNASTIDRPEIQRALAKLDSVKLSLDCPTPECFRKLDRPLGSVELHRIVEGIRQFRRGYERELVLEILMVPGINATDEAIAAFNDLLPTLGADRIDIGTVDRPPSYPVEPLSLKALHEIAQKFDPALPIHIASRSGAKEAKSAFSDDEILTTLQKRPLTLDEIEALFDEGSQLRFHELLERGKIERKMVGGLLFYGTGFSKQKRKSS